MLFSLRQLSRILPVRDGSRKSRRCGCTRRDFGNSAKSTRFFFSAKSIVTSATILSRIMFSSIQDYDWNTINSSNFVMALPLSIAAFAMQSLLKSTVLSPGDQRAAGVHQQRCRRCAPLPGRIKYCATIRHCLQPCRLQGLAAARDKPPLPA